LFPRGAASIRTIATITTKQHITKISDLEINFSIMTLSLHRFRLSDLKRYSSIS
jgi:hypothetical protein